MKPFSKFGFGRKKTDNRGKEVPAEAVKMPETEIIPDSDGMNADAQDEPAQEGDFSDTLVLDESVTLRLNIPDTAPAPAAGAGSQRFPQAGISIGSASLKGTREYQQDALAYKTAGWKRNAAGRAAAVLCDGMGGLNAGEKASGLACGRLIEELDVPWGQFPGVLSDALSDINYEVAHLRDEKGTPLGCGTTAVAVVVEGDGMYYASVGDSRIYLIRSGRLRCLTRDHTYGNELDDQAAAGKISPEKARASENRAALTSYLGIRRLDQIDSNRDAVHLIPGDIVLLCSDGLYKSLPEPEFVTAVTSCGTDMQLAARYLAERAVGMPGRHDNTTVVLMGYLPG